MYSFTKLILTTLCVVGIPVLATAQDSTRREAPAAHMAGHETKLAPVVGDTLTTAVTDQPARAIPAAAPRNIVETATAAGSFNTFVAALKTAGLTAKLEGKGPFTIFAPTDAAFDKLPKRKLDALLNNPTQLRAVLGNHVVAGDLTSAQVAKLTSAKTIDGKTLRIAVKAGRTFVGTAQVTNADITATNGVVHAIDTVLLPN
jgi:uncharacterized surface protein with fasciclin (FAS1) repeats